ncbi:MAG: hypothetical protein ACPGXK_16415 [Phycisphaerae bacterium]
MQIFIDDQQIEPAPQLFGTIEQSVRQLQQEVCDPGRIVIAVRCNGEELQADNIAAELSKPIDNLQKLELFTGLPGQLVSDAMSQAAEMLTALEEHYKQVAEQLTDGRTNEGMSTLGACVQVWQQVHEAVGKSIAMLELNIEGMMVQEVSFLDAMGRPKEVLLQLKSALESGDHVLIADILQYELKDVTDLWHAVVATIRREAIKQSGDPEDDAM